MTAIDYKHQDIGAAFLAERRFALLADEPGLGKTRECVMAADLARIDRILVVCPGVVRRHWESEFLQWQTIDRPVSVEEGFLDASPSRYGVTVVSHATLSDAAQRKTKTARVGSITRLFEGAPYDLIVVDESAEFRHYQAARTRTLLGPDGLASRSARTWLLSGTPVVNSAADLYPLAYGSRLTDLSWLDFCTHYCDMRNDPFKGLKPAGIRNAAELAAGLRPHVLRRTIESLGIPMPPLDVARAQIDTNQAEVTRIMSDLSGWTPDQLTTALDNGDELRDAAMSRVRRALGGAKAVAAAEHVVAILRSGEGPVVAFFHHTDTRIAMHAALAHMGFVCSWIDGDVSSAQLRAAREWFQGGRIDVLLVQTQCGGQGLTLTRAHRSVVVELPWTAAALFQAVKRIHRIGQTLACRVELLVSPRCWLDEVLASVVARKERASDELMRLLTSST